MNTGNNIKGGQEDMNKNNTNNFLESDR